MILDNANVLTMDEVMPTTRAVAIAGGRVLAGVDSREDAIASHAHERIDLQGATVIPGLVDSHVHFRAWAAARERVRLDASMDLAAALTTIESRARDLAPDAWVLGTGWSDATLPRGTDHAAALERAAGGRPVAMVSKDGHGLWTTATSVEQLGMTLADLDVAGGVVEHTDDRRFSGVLREESAWAVRRRLPSDDITTRVLAGAMREATRRGITTLHDMDGAAGFRAFQQLDAERGLTFRVIQHLLAADLPHARELGLRGGFGSGRLRIGGIKAFADGTLGSGTAWLDEPELAGAHGEQPRDGVTINDAAAIEQLARDAADAGFSLLVHAIGDAACGAVIDALETTQDAWRPLGVAPRIEHAQLMRVADIERCARLGIALSVQPTHLVADRAMVDTRWADRADRAYAFRTMLDAGCGLLLGSDAPIEDLHPLAAMHAATMRDGGAHGLDDARGAWHPEQAIDPMDALRASTCWPADALGLDGELGRLLPGRQADLVVLSGDPTTTPYADIEVVATMVDGRWTHGAAALH